MWLTCISAVCYHENRISAVKWKWVLSCLSNRVPQIRAMRVNARLHTAESSNLFNKLSVLFICKKSFLVVRPE